MPEKSQGTVRSYDRCVCPGNLLGIDEYGWIYQNTVKHDEDRLHDVSLVSATELYIVASERNVRANRYPNLNLIRMIPVRTPREALPM